MPQLNGNSFKVAFWVMSTLFTVGILGSSTWIGANEIRGQARDAKIIEKHEKDMSEFKDSVQMKFEKIMVALAVLKSNSEAIKKKLDK